MYKKFLSNRRGNFAAMFCFCSFPLLAGIGMAIEYSNITNQRAKLQNAVDAAVLFAGRHVEKTGSSPSQNDVDGFIDSNFEGSFSIKKFEHNASGLHLAVNTDIPPFFFGSIYPEAFKQEVAASVPTRKHTLLEIAMVLDNTLSMKDVADPTSLSAARKMDNLKVAAKYFATSLDSLRGDYGEIKIGLVPFDKYVNIGTDKVTEPWLAPPAGGKPFSGCVGSRPDPHTLTIGNETELDPSGAPRTVQYPGINEDEAVQGCPLTPVVELTDSHTKIIDGIDAMSAAGQTYIAPGVLWGANLLSDGDPFDGATPFASPGAPTHINHRKIMVIMTDGTNNKAPSLPSSHLHNGFVRGYINVPGHPAMNIYDPTADDNTREMCRNARNAGIITYTIVFGEIPLRERTTIESVMLDCAGDTTRYFRAQNGVALQDAFKAIFEQLYALVLSS